MAPTIGPGSRAFAGEAADQGCGYLALANKIARMVWAHDGPGASDTREPAALCAVNEIASDNRRACEGWEGEQHVMQRPVDPAIRTTHMVP